MRWMLIVLVVGCSSAGSSHPANVADQATCVEVGRTLRGVVSGVDASRFKQKSITRTCEGDRWTAAAINCIAREQQIYVCRELLTEAQRDSYKLQLCAYQKRFPDEEVVIESCDLPRIARKSGTLYDRLGGLDTIAAVVAEWMTVVASDPRISMMFANVSMPELRKHLVDQICQATGGPCKYTGKDMQTAHTGMGITDVQFDAMIEDLGKALDKHKVGKTEKAELATALIALRGDVVQP
ncbi:MAG: group 1 truncated hemoglobin [Kofleriaceae bacterium]